MATKARRAGQRLTADLLWINTETLVVDRASDEAFPSLSRMLSDLRITYTNAVGPEITFRQAGDAAAAAGLRPAEQLRLHHYGPQLSAIVANSGATVSGHGVNVDERRLTPDDARTITRAWEVSLDDVHLLTHVNAETGDVLTQSAYPASTPALAPAVTFHAEMTDLAVKTW